LTNLGLHYVAYLSIFFDNFLPDYAADRLLIIHSIEHWSCQN